MMGSTKYTWEDVFKTIFWSGIVTALIFVGLCVSADKTPHKYYLGQQGTATPATQCVYADFPWIIDEIVFCSANTVDVYKFMDEANSRVVQAEKK